jgi:hypothetical protein
MDPTTTAPALPELDRGCGDCQGSGIVTTPEWLQWDKWSRAVEADWKAAHPGEPWLDGTRCVEVEDAQPDPEMPCPKCDGKGCILTEAGRELLRFLSRHGKGWPKCASSSPSS